MKRLYNELRNRKKETNAGRIHFLKESGFFLFSLTISRSHIANKRFLACHCSRHATNCRDALLNHRSIGSNQKMSCDSERGTIQIVEVDDVRVNQVIDDTDMVTLLKDVGHALNC